jgi:putative transposase
MLIDRKNKLSTRRQCDILEVCRASVYYKVVPTSALNLDLMDKIDRQFMKYPFYGRAKLTQYLRELGHGVNPKRVSRLMKLLGIRAIIPRLNTSKRNVVHKVYPYLLRGLKISKANQVWATDITFIRLKTGFMYLSAVIDLFSRYVLSWELSNTMDADFCVETLEEALEASKELPEIFNTDQGSQFTSEAFTGTLLKRGIRISMDGRGRALDNVFVERLWRSVKYECVYLRQWESVGELRSALKEYFVFFNTERYHQALDYKTPKEVYFGENAIQSVKKMMDLTSCGNVENPSGLHTVPQLLLR